MNVYVGLGASPVTVTGLLGNPNNNPSVLQSRNGVSKLVPEIFDTDFFTFLYNEFGPSWRVPAATSLLRPCNATLPPYGAPAGKFFATENYLSASQVAFGRGACQAAGVFAEAWLDACALDVVVFNSPSAAAAYVGLRPPVVNGNRQPPPCPRSAPICPVP